VECRKSLKRQTFFHYGNAGMLLAIGNVPQRRGYQQETDMSIHIDRIADIDKLFAFLRVGAKAKFEVAAGLLQELVERVRKWAKEKNIHVQFTAPDGAKLAAFTGAGAACGLVAGLLLGLTTGPLVAAGMAGAAAGYAAAHVTIVVTPSGAAGGTTVTIA
jgi:hypothetical protein